MIEADVVSRETFGSLMDLLLRWQGRINLISPDDVAHIWERHIEDSLRLSPIVARTSGLWADLGSGGGFPILPLAMVHRNRQFASIESDGRKAAFIKAARREFDIDLDVHNARIESLPPLHARVVSARALAPLERLLDLATRHGRPTTKYVFMKGRNWEEEVREAQSSWSFDLAIHPGTHDDQGPVLELENVVRREAVHAHH